MICIPEIFFLKIQTDSGKFAVDTFGFYHAEVPQIVTDGIANSVDIEKTAPLGEVRSGFARIKLCNNVGSIL